MVCTPVDSRSGGWQRRGLGGRKDSCRCLDMESGRRRRVRGDQGGPGELTVGVDEGGGFEEAVLEERMVSGGGLRWPGVHRLFPFPATWLSSKCSNSQHTGRPGPSSPGSPTQPRLQNGLPSQYALASLPANAA